jgi:hypothetical protein
LTIHELIKWLILVDTANDPIKVIIDNILPWSDRSPQRTALEKHQDAIGWDIVLEGKLSHAWVIHQQCYFTMTGSTKKRQTMAGTADSQTLEHCLVHVGTP